MEERKYACYPKKKLTLSDASYDRRRITAWVPKTLRWLSSKEVMSW